MPLLDRRLFLTTTAVGATVSLAGCGAQPPRQGIADVPVVTAAFALSAGLAAAAAAAPQVAAVHQAHVDALRKIATDPLGSPSPAPAAGSLLQREQAAIQQLSALAGRAQDGRLARLLAEMGAAIQQLIATRTIQ